MQTIKADNLERIETGGLKINDDWTGLFIRGDSCIELINVLTSILNQESGIDWTQRFILENYVEIIKKEVLV